MCRQRTMTKLLEDNDSLLVLEFGDHVWIYHQNMTSLKKDYQVEDLDCWKKGCQWTGFGWLESEMLAVDLFYLAVSWECRDPAWTVDWIVKLLQRWSHCVQKRKKKTEKCLSEMTVEHLEQAQRNTRREFWAKLWWWDWS